MSDHFSHFSSPYFEVKLDEDAIEKPNSVKMEVQVVLALEDKLIQITNILAKNNFADMHLLEGINKKVV